MASWIADCQILVCVGTGGVGKTSVSAALGWAEAEKGKKVLVLTIDPARRLADAIGVDATKPSVQTLSGGGRFEAAMIHAEEIFGDFIRRLSPNAESADRLMRNRLFQKLMTTLSGSQEFTSLERLLLAQESGKYDLIVLDTPPSQHAIDFLRAPEKIFGLFQERITKWFITNHNANLLQWVFQKGTRTVVAALEKITGSGFVTELAEFFSAAADLQEQVAKRSIAVHRLLVAQGTGFILISSSDEAKLREAFEFTAELQKSGHHLVGVVVNRCAPKWLRPAKNDQLMGDADETLQRLVAYHQKLAQFFAEKEAAHRELVKKWHGQLAVKMIPEDRNGIDGIEGLKRVAQYLA